MLTGSMAMNYYAQPRMTRDINMVVALEAKDSDKVVRKEDLIISKLLWAKDSSSELQLRDVANLAATPCDQDYLERWTEELGVKNLWKGCKP